MRSGSIVGGVSITEMDSSNDVLLSGMASLWLEERFVFSVFGRRSRAALISSEPDQMYLESFSFDEGRAVSLVLPPLKGSTR